MSASKVCPSCGALNGPTNLFCVHCGKPMFAGAAEPSTTVLYPSVGPPGTPGVPGAYPYFPSPPPRRANASAILSGLFDVWTKNFANFFIVFFVLALVNGLIVGLFRLALLGTFGAGIRFFPGTFRTGVTSASLAGILLFVVVAVVAAVILSSIVNGGMTEYAVRRFRGESITLERALRRGLEKFLSILGANILLNVLLFALVLVPLLFILLPFAAGTPADPTSALATICGAIVVLLIGGGIAIYVEIAMSLYAPAIMMENAHATDGLMRSWRVTKHHWWSLFGAFLIAGIVAFIISLALTFSTSFLGSPIVDLLVAAIVSGLVGGWSVILTSVAYDLIVRQPSFGPPGFYPGGPMGPPAGVQSSQPPPVPPSPPGP